jgi:hypothetical protein
MERLKMRPLDLWKSIDVNKDSKITKEELTAGLERFAGGDLTEKDVDDMIVAYDTDENGTLDVKEWKVGLAESFDARQKSRGKLGQGKAVKVKAAAAASAPKSQTYAEAYAAAAIAMNTAEEHEEGGDYTAKSTSVTEVFVEWDSSYIGDRIHLLDDGLMASANLGDDEGGQAVRSKQPLSATGRHYIEYVYTGSGSSGSRSKPGSSLGGYYMVGLVSATVKRNAYVAKQDYSYNAVYHSSAWWGLEDDGSLFAGSKDATSKIPKKAKNKAGRAYGVGGTDSLASLSSCRTLSENPPTLLLTHSENPPSLLRRTPSSRRTPPSSSPPDVVGMEVDMDKGTLRFYRNSELLFGADIGTGAIPALEVGLGERFYLVACPFHHGSSVRAIVTHSPNKGVPGVPGAPTVGNNGDALAQQVRAAKRHSILNPWGMASRSALRKEGAVGNEASGGGVGGGNTGEEGGEEEEEVPAARQRAPTARDDTLAALRKSSTSMAATVGFLNSNVDTEE